MNRDAVAASRWRYLHHLNPLATLGAPIPIIVAVLFTQGLLTPAVLVALAYAIILTGTRLTRFVAVLLFAIVPLGVLVLGAGLTLWTDPSRLADAGAPLVGIGGWTVMSGAAVSGYATALRITVMLILTIMAGIATTGPDLVRSAVQHLHLPYRLGYTALAAYRFVPRFKHELAIIRAAHRVRGRGDGHGPIAAARRAWGYVLPLMAGGIRHAERVALAMDSRAFGAHPDRTERHDVPWRTRDWLFLIGFPLVSAVLMVLCWDR